MSAEHSDTRLSVAERDLLVEKARAVLHQAYAPYSKFRVGAAVLTEAGNIHVGCNVENASYGLTNCAERTAIFSAVAAEGPEMRVQAIAIWNEPAGPCSPCGACRQVIFEMGRNCVVLFQGENGEVVETTAADLLPYGFSF